jgi:dihydrofolate synthase/folylpolyglutamate synthase
MNPLPWLFELEQFGVKFGLENITSILDELGHPERAFQAVHIAGTNGKGSVTAMVDTALRAAGHRSARYTSPHLVDLSERFVIDGRPVADETMRRVVTDLREVVERLRASGRLQDHPTFFEVTTAAAFELFRRAGVSVAVCEVGLGGRLDATNVLNPVVTAITSISLDHERYLGSTLKEIAAEKAGILKAGVPVVVGRMDAEAFDMIAEIARNRGCEVVRAVDVSIDGLQIGLRGQHQHDNARVAVAVLKTLNGRGISVPAAAVIDGLANVMWPGRLDLRRLPDGREVLIDAAHNPAGAAALAAFMKEIFRDPVPLVFAVMRDKDLDGIVRSLAPVVSTFVVTRASTPRTAEPADLADRIRTLAPGASVAVEASSADALKAAWRLAPRIVVAGSIFLIGDVMKEIETT